jgi:hypothetical protein
MKVATYGSKPSSDARRLPDEALLTGFARVRFDDEQADSLSSVGA